MRPIAVLLVFGQLAAGCATVVKSEPAPGQSEAKMARDRAECSQAAARSLDSGALAEGARAGGLVGAYLVLVGAAEGAHWGALIGGSAAEGAWIGAAAGAGIGIIVGLVAGIMKGVDQHRQYRQAYERCLSERGLAL